MPYHVHIAQVLLYHNDNHTNNNKKTTPHTKKKNEPRLYLWTTPYDKLYK